jgi:hypothetical protein
MTRRDRNRTRPRRGASDARLVVELLACSVAAVVLVPLALALGAYGALAVCDVLYSLR